MNRSVSDPVPTQSDGITGSSGDESSEKKTTCSTVIRYNRDLNVRDEGSRNWRPFGEIETSVRQHHGSVTNNVRVNV